MTIEIKDTFKRRIRKEVSDLWTDYKALWSKKEMGWHLIWAGPAATVAIAIIALIGLVIVILSATLSALRTLMECLLKGFGFAIGILIALEIFLRMVNLK